MSDEVKPQIVREAKRRLEENRRKQKAFLSYGSKPFALNTFIEGGMYGSGLVRALLEEAKSEVKALRHELKLLEDRYLRAQAQRPNLAYRRAFDPPDYSFDHHLKIHFSNESTIDKLCNTKSSPYGVTQVTKERDKVTCKYCKALLGKVQP